MNDFDDGVLMVLKAALQAAHPDPELRVDEWSEQYVVLPKSSPRPGPYRFEHSPYARRVAEVLSPHHPCKRVVAKVASQMFKTQIALNWIGACIHRAPANILALQPTDGLAKRFSARVSQMARMIPVLRECISAEKSRDKRNTTQAKDFRGDATLYINTSGSSSNLAEITARYIFIDEIDRMEINLDGEGDPVMLAEARATQFQHNCKFYEVGSPTIRGFSRTDQLFAMGTQEVYEVPCPHCGHLHELLLSRFHYDKEMDSAHITRAWFVCPACGGIIEEHHKTTLLPDEALGGLARWVAKSRGDGETISFTLSAFYMPMGAITWLSLARQYARAKEQLDKGDVTQMQVFYNTRLGLSYEHSEGTTTAQELQARAENYPPRIVPDAALVLTMAVDTQRNRLEVQVEAWGADMEHWILDYIVLHGNPTDPPHTVGSVWQRLDEIRRTPWAHARGGKPLLISAYAIDSGGSNTQDVYNYGSNRRQVGCLIVRGSSRPNRPIISTQPSKVDIEWDGTKVPNGAELFLIGTDVAKDYLLGRLSLSSGAGAMHFHNQLETSWFEGLLSERVRVKYVKGYPIRQYFKANSDRNESLDLSVYNLAVAYHLGLHKWSARDWQRLRDRLQPPNMTLDLFPPETTISNIPPSSSSSSFSDSPKPSEVSKGSESVESFEDAKSSSSVLPLTESFEAAGNLSKNAIQSAWAQPTSLTNHLSRKSKLPKGIKL